MPETTDKNREEARGVVAALWVRLDDADPDKFALSADDAIDTVLEYGERISDGSKTEALREAAERAWNKYPEVKPSDGQKVLCLIWGTDIFPATFIESSNGRHHGWFPEVDCISVAGDLVGRMDPTNPCFEGEVDYWMECPALPGERVRDSYTLSEPRTCETCAPQPADVETVRELVDLLRQWLGDDLGSIKDCQCLRCRTSSALDRIAGRLPR